jgi:hypothetical protein
MEIVSKIFLCVGLILFSVFGSCVKWLSPTRQAPSTIKVLVVDAVTAAFVGGLVYCVYLWLQCHEGLAFVIAGLAGYFGTKSIDMLGKFVIKKCNLDDLSADLYDNPQTAVTGVTGTYPTQTALPVEDKPVAKPESEDPETEK